MFSFLEQIHKTQSQRQKKQHTIQTLLQFKLLYPITAMPWQILSSCQKETEKEDGFKFTMRANNNPWDKLTFTIYKDPDNQGIMLTLPEFETIMF